MTDAKIVIPLFLGLVRTLIHKLKPYAPLLHKCKDLDVARVIERAGDPLPFDIFLHDLLRKCPEPL